MLFSLLFLAAAAPHHVAQAHPPPPLIRVPPPVHLDHSAASRRALVEGLRSSAGNEVLAAIQRNFPEDYETLIDRLLDFTISARGDARSSREFGFQEMARFVHSKGADVLNAPTASLLAIEERTLALFRAAATIDPVFCGRLVVNGNRDPNGVPPALLPQFAALSVATIDAAGAGHRAAEHPAGRGTLVREDAVAFMARMRALDTGNELAPLLTNPAALAQAAPTVQCRLGTITYEALGALPPEQGASMLAYFLGEALRNQQP